jgi:hypothetical protein
MVNRGVAATLSVTLFLDGAWGAGTWHGSNAVRHPAPAIEEHAPQAAPASAIGWSDLPTPLIEPAPEGRVDLYGNDVTDAIATYKSDRTGAVYEEHSPQTEVPRLAPPTI